jgi:hypothetical protein
MQQQDLKRHMVPVAITMDKEDKATTDHQAEPAFVDGLSNQTRHHLLIPTRKVAHSIKVALAMHNHTNDLNTGEEEYQYHHLHHQEDTTRTYLPDHNTTGE